ncbi:MAG: sensor histidine kinase [Lachnospiraceae bacterium]|nr:sensor histidine kinase [Lachnospiraceae bacterium]
MERERCAPSLHRQLSAIILLCWLLPMVLAAAVVGFYLSFGLGRQAEEAMAEQFQLNLQMGADRIDSAVEASRLPSYDPAFQESWKQYRQDGNYTGLYRQASALFSRLYQSDSRFLYAVFCFSEDPQQMSITVVNGSSGLLSNQVRSRWQEDAAAVQELATGLDTSVGFLETNDQVYLVRNMMDSDYQPIGVLALALDLSYYFDDLSALNGASAVSVCLGPDTWLVMKGETLPSPGKGVLEQQVKGRSCQLSGLAALDYDILLAGFGAYRYLLLAMGISLLLLLLLTFRFFRREISQPVAALMAGADEIQKGRLGSQIEYRPESRELAYLTDSFNQMSTQLERQFVQLYQEELARKDAQIKALQAHINPHFLNNTLESINWQARMNGDIEASRMIEALSTVLDAALDRTGSPQVRLSEEMAYVSAYLYIISRRFERRLTVKIDLGKELMDCMVPRLILQPVIENAVEHGIAPGGQGHITLRGFLLDEFLILEIENDGGLTEKDKEHIARLLSPDYDMSGERSGNIGIANVNTRLRILYGPECGLTIVPGEGKLVTARLTIARKMR